MEQRRLSVLLPLVGTKTYPDIVTAIAESIEKEHQRSIDLACDCTVEGVCSHRCGLLVPITLGRKLLNGAHRILALKQFWKETDVWVPRGTYYA